MPSARIIQFATPDFDQAIRLRDEVLRQPLGLHFSTEDIAKEYDSYHIGKFDIHGRIMSVLVVKPLNAELVKIRQVAVQPSLQGQGLGKQLMYETEQWLSLNNYRQVELNARENVVPFYKKIGYTPEGDPFEEVGIPHLKMVKLL